jgi:hypothetical protein
MAQRARRSTALVVVGVCALALGGWFGYLTWRDTGGRSTEPTAAAAPSVHTDRVVSRAGHFSVAVPTAMSVDKHGRTVRLSSRDRDLVITVGPGKKGRLPQANRRLLAELASTYGEFEPLAAERLEVGGRPALSASGTLTNRAGVRLRFVAVTVRANPRNYALVAFAARTSNPVSVLPQVNAVASGFEVLGR